MRGEGKEKKGRGGGGGTILFNGNMDLTDIDGIMGLIYYCQDLQHCLWENNKMNIWEDLILKQKNAPVNSFTYA